MQYYNIHHIDFKTNSEIYFTGLSKITKISDCTFGPFNKNSRALKKFEKVSCKQLLLHLLAKF